MCQSKSYLESTLEGQNVRNFQYPVRIRWSKQPNLAPFYLYNRTFECPENIRKDGFPDVRWSSTPETTRTIGDGWAMVCMYLNLYDWQVFNIQIEFQHYQIEFCHVLVIEALAQMQ